MLEKYELLNQERKILDKKKRVAAYCRVSTDKADQLNSLETQKEFFSEYTQRTGDTLVRLYADEGCSGTKINTRKDFLLMMADAVEAVSRSLPEYTEESINNLVEKIIVSQVEEGFFKECPITFKDIAIVKSVFKEKLKTIYHTRISYPELKK